jgi:hypothetical protein
VSVGVPVSFAVSPYGLLNPAYSLGDSFSNSSIQSYDLSSAGAFHWTPLPQDIGTHTITVSASDRFDNAASVSVAITVLAVPAVSFINVVPGTTVDVGKTLAFAATSTGLIGPAYAVVDTWGGSSSSTITIDSSGKAQWTPVYNDIGVHHFAVTASDATGRSARAVLSITVPPSLPPAAPAGVPAPSPAPSAPQGSAGGASASAPAPTKSAGKSSTAAAAPPPPAQSAPAGAGAAPASSTPVHLETDSTPIPIPPDESFGAFIVRSISGFFASLLRLF